MLTIVMLLAGSAAFRAQQAPPAKPQLTALLAQLHAANWSDRADAYEQLSTDPSAMSTPQVKTALIDLLNRENRADISKEPGFNPNDDHEGHAEYIAELLGTVESLIDWKNTAQLCILAHAPYNEDSPFAARLAAAGKPILPCLLQMTDSKQTNDRVDSVALLIQMREKDRDLDLQTSDQIRAITIRALHDSTEAVRVFTVDALRSFGTPDMISSLEDVAEHDPGREVQGQSVRTIARQAIAAIQKRNNQPGSR